MPKNVKLAILRARNDPSQPTISNQACIEMLMTSQTRRSVLDYWTDNTEGYLDFVGSVLFPWVNITITAADVDSNGQVPRATQVRKAYEATQALDPVEDLAGFDGYIVITHPGQTTTIPNPMAGQPGQPAQLTVGFDAGATGHQNKPACALPVMTSDHTFMCHEVGHVLGFKHTYGVLNNGVDWDATAPWVQAEVYGDPFDIMSSATFGRRLFEGNGPSLNPYDSQPQFTGAAVAGWPFAGSTAMGPAPARAHVHQWDPQAFPPGSVRHLQIPSGAPHSIRLYAAGSHKGSPRLVVIHRANEDAEGRGRCYLEYRDTSGWDEGLDLAGADLARRAVVAHTLADATQDGVRLWYRGRIIVPVEIDSDLKVAGTPLTVRVIESDVVEGYVDIEIAISSPRGIDLDISRTDDIVGGFNQQPMGTPCGETIVHGTWITTSHYVYRPSTYGYGGEGAPGAPPPRLTWTVGGIPVPAGSGSLSVSTPDGTFAVDYSLDPARATLLLTSRSGDKYGVPVVATATEPAGGNATTTASAFEPLGSFTGFRPGDLGVLDRCMRKYLISVQLEPHELLIPPGPDPYREPWRDQINNGRVQDIIQAIAPSHPAQSVAIGAVAALRYGGFR